MKTMNAISLAGVGFISLVAPIRADTLYFRGSSDNLWTNPANWFVTDTTGNYMRANRLPNAPDSVVLQSGPDGQTGIYEVSSMILEGVNVMNGDYYAQTIQMLPGSSFTGSTITVEGNGQNGELQVLSVGAQATLNGVTLIIQGGRRCSLPTGPF